MALEAFTGFTDTDWSSDPDDARLVRVDPEATGEGLPCQLHVVVEFMKGGKGIGKRKLTINSGLIGDENFGETTFEDFWDMVPDVSQEVKDAIMAKLPKKVLQQLWLGRKL